MRTLRLLVLAALMAALLVPAAAALSLRVPSADVTLDGGSLDARLADGILGAGLRLDAPLLPALPDPARLFDAPATGILIEDPDAAGQAQPAPEPMPVPVVASPEAVTAGATLLWIILERLGATRVMGAALAALYARVQPNELLEHSRRERVVTMVRERPGIGPQEIADALGTGWGVTSYHLDRLERAGLVTSQRSGHHRCYFVPGSVPRDSQRTHAMVRGETTRRIAVLVTEKPGLTQSELCGALGLSASAASKQLTRLEAAALVRREAAHNGVRVFPAATLTDALA